MSAQIIHISEGTLRLTVCFYRGCKANVFHTGASDMALHYQPQRGWQTPDDIQATGAFQYEPMMGCHLLWIIWAFISDHVGKGTSSESAREVTWFLR